MIPNDLSCPSVLTECLSFLWELRFGQLPARTESHCRCWMLLALCPLLQRISFLPRMQTKAEAAQGSKDTEAGGVGKQSCSQGGEDGWYQMLQVRGCFQRPGWMVDEEVKSSEGSQGHPGSESCQQPKGLAEIFRDWLLEELKQLCPRNSCFHQMVSGFGISFLNICGETPVHHSLLFRLFKAILSATPSPASPCQTGKCWGIQKRGFL